MPEVIQYLSGMSNGFFIKDSEIIAVDTGSELGGDVFLAVCAEHGIDPAAIKLIIITHEHVDHFYNIEAMKELTGAPVLCHEGAGEYLKNGIMPNVRPRNETGVRIQAEEAANGGPPCTSAPKLTPDIVWSGEEYDLKPWGVDGKIIHTPGHSNGSTAVILSSREAIVADTVVVTPWDGSAGLAYFSEGNANDTALYKSVRLILDAADTIYSGHGGPFSKAEVLEALNKEETMPLKS